MPTPGYERTREGTEDYRWLEALEKRLAEWPEHPAAPAAQKLLDSIRKGIPAYLEPTSQAGGTARSKLRPKLPQWREQILRTLVRLEREPEEATETGKG